MKPKLKGNIISEFVNWNRYNISLPGDKEQDVVYREALPYVSEACCENGWIRYENSCYLLRQEKGSMVEQEQFCYDHNATLFVANSMDEWVSVPYCRAGLRGLGDGEVNDWLQETIRRLAPLASFNWIGLMKFASDACATWQTSGGFNPNNMWVVCA